MFKKFTFLAAGMAALMSFPTTLCAQDVELRGVKNTMRYDDGDDTKYQYLGWDAEQGKAIFNGDVGLWKLNVSGNNVSSALVHYDHLMYGNSGSVYVNGVIYTIYSREKEDGTAGEMEFVVRSWNAETNEKISEVIRPKSANLESRGLTFNPIDKKVYGLFYITDAALPDPDAELDPEDVQEGYTTDAGYALGTLNLETMEVTQITPGLYYDNFVTLSCNPEGRIFTISAGGQLVEFNAQTGLIETKTVENEEGELEEVNKYGDSGVVTQFKRQAACFDYNTGKLYWNGYVNSGKGYNDWGSYGPLPDREWRTNGKYDTALYEVDIETGKATRISLIPNRIAFSCLWVVGGEASDITGIKNIATGSADGLVKVYNTSGQLVYSGKQENANLGSGMYIIKGGATATKVLVK